MSCPELRRQSTKRLECAENRKNRRMSVFRPAIRTRTRVGSFLGKVLDHHRYPGHTFEPYSHHHPVIVPVPPPQYPQQRQDPQAILTLWVYHAQSTDAQPVGQSIVFYACRIRVCAWKDGCGPCACPTGSVVPDPGDAYLGPRGITPRCVGVQFMGCAETPAQPLFIGRLCARGYAVRLHMHAGVPAGAKLWSFSAIASSRPRCQRREIVIYDLPNHRAFLFPSTSSTFILSRHPS
ncbi:hypothetical protein BJ912DRAFT_1144510 [Pholiota molesta]|nr:hypothetical protein BJ912DRAFT_1144510 [Pholiota molesta]